MGLEKLGSPENRDLRFRCAKIDPNPKFHFEPFVHHYNGTFKSYRQQKNGSMGRVKGGYQQQIFYLMRGTALKIPPILRPNGFFEKGFFAGPLAWRPPCPTPDPPRCFSRGFMIITGSGGPGTAIGHVGGVRGGRRPLRDVIAQLKTGFVLRLSQRDPMGRIERNSDGAALSGH